MPQQSVTANKQIKILAREVKLCLYDSYNKKFIGNSIFVPGFLGKNGENSWDFKSVRNKLTGNFNHVFIRLANFNGIDCRKEDLKIIFELVLSIKSRQKSLFELVSGWCEINYNELIKTNRKEHSLAIKGGSVVMPTYVDESSIKQKKGFFDLYLRKSKSCLIIKSTNYNNKKNQRLLDFKQNYLPNQILFHGCSVGFLTAIRQYQGYQLYGEMIPARQLKQDLHLETLLHVLDCQDVY